MNVLRTDRQAQVVAGLVEGCSMKSISRLTGIHPDTIMRLGVKVGQQCRNLHDRIFRDLNVGIVELDEQWSFVQKKNRNVHPGDPAEYGDSWLFIALAANQKAVISYVVGKRTSANTEALANALRARLVTRPQITADGYAPYLNAIDGAFGIDVDFATVTKQYQEPPREPAAHRCSTSSIRAIEKTVIRGNPDESKISTSYVERFNLTTRMQLRRFSRLTNGFSKKAENHAAAIALHIAHYNLCRSHESLRMTPAMALGVTNRIWTIGELLDQASRMPIDPPPAAKPPTAMRLGLRPVQLRVIPGGRMTKPRT
jgi:IS1 family transposase